MSEKVLKARCNTCDISFGIAYLPLQITKMTKVIKKAVCPKCGATSKGLVLDASNNPPDIPMPGTADRDA